MPTDSIGPEIYKNDKEDFWYTSTAESVLKALNATETGLKEKEAEERREKFGINAIEDKKGMGPLKLLWKKLNSMLIYVLLVTSLISLYLGHLIEFYAIMGVIVFTVGLGFIHEYRAEKSVEALKELTAKKVQVIREGKKVEDLAENLVPGDVVVLERGLVIPADVRILESNALSINESILTGESVPKGKIAEKIKDKKADVTEQDNMAFSGTSVMNGSGLAVVVKTGMQTEIGKISERLASIRDQKTPLQKKIDRMSSRISYSVITIAVLAFVFLLFVRGEELGAALILVAALAVAGIPEEFPLSLTMALATGIRRMAHSNAIVKDMGSVETLGTTTVICTDKTGTLTQNKMEVEKLNLGGEDIDVDGKPYDPNATFMIGKKTIDKRQLENHKEFFHTAILCSNASIFKKRRKWELKGEPTEGSLLTVAKAAGFSEDTLKRDNKRVLEEPFDSAKKYMITVNRSHNGHTAHMKGAVEKVLARCTHISKEGRVKRLTAKDKEEIERKMEEYSSQALRVLALATKSLGKGKKSEKELEKVCNKGGYVFRGIAGIKDPVRDEVIGSVRDCKTAGIRIIMITGDHKNTAYAIGKQLGIVTDEYSKAVEGKEIDEMTDKELDKIIPHVAIFARATPEHKFRIVQSLQREGEIVAMTGDGVNDAPALKKADIGVSMGKGGTDVAREASNMVLVDDAFSSIVEAVREGRTIYSNIRRFTYYLLTVNAAEVGIIVMAILFGLTTPLTALMILFINTIISSFPALALSIEPTKKKVMHYLPRDPKDKLLSEYIMLKIAVVLPFIVAGSLGLFLWEMNWGGGDLATARTLAFATLILCELIHAFNARSLHISIFQHGMLKNMYFYSGVTIAVIFTLLSIYTDTGNTILGTTPIAGIYWVYIVLIGSTSLLSTEFVKLVTRSEVEEEKKYQGSDFVIE